MAEVKVGDYIKLKESNHWKVDKEILVARVTEVTKDYFLTTISNTFRYNHDLSFRYNTITKERSCIYLLDKVISKQEATEILFKHETRKALNQYRNILVTAIRNRILNNSGNLTIEELEQIASIINVTCIQRKHVLIENIVLP